METRTEVEGAGFSNAISKVVWLEPGDTRPRSAYGRIVRDVDGFIDVRLIDGRFLRIRQSCVIKIEEGDSRG